MLPSGCEGLPIWWLRVSLFIAAEIFAHRVPLREFGRTSSPFPGLSSLFVTTSRCDKINPNGASYCLRPNTFGDYKLQCSLLASFDRDSR